MARTLATANAAVAALPVCWNPRGFAADLATLAEVTIPKPINVLLIGAGCGAPLVALDRLGVQWDTALVYEIDNDCISVLHARWPGKIQVMKNDVYCGMRRGESGRADRHGVALGAEDRGLDVFCE